MTDREQDLARQNGPQQAGGSTHTNQNMEEQQGIKGPGAGDGAGEPGAQKTRDDASKGQSSQ